MSLLGRPVRSTVSLPDPPTMLMVEVSSAVPLSDVRTLTVSPPEPRWMTMSSIPSMRMVQGSYGTSTIRMDGIEDIVIHLGSGGDTVNVLTSLNGTALDTSTINIVGGSGNDTVDLTGRPSNDIHRVVVDGAGGNDTVKLNFGYSAITGVVAVTGGFQISHDG